MDYTSFYNKISKPYKENRLLLFILRFIYYSFPVITFILYIMMILYSFYYIDIQTCLKVVIIPFLTFVLVSVLRKIFNIQRPYEAVRIFPLIPRSKDGESFPSRHTVSLGIIAMAGLYLNIYLGIILWAMTIIQGFVRVIAGVHYPKDIYCGIIISVLSGISFFI